jgi:hypothetical protein
LYDLSLAELAVIDMQWWHELAQAQSAWINGRTAGGNTDTTPLDAIE